MKCGDCEEEFFTHICPQCQWEPDDYEGPTYEYCLGQIQIGTCYQENGMTTIHLIQDATIPGKQPAISVEGDDPFSLDEAEKILKTFLPKHVGKYLERILEDERTLLR